ncbi:MAG TPA: NTP transferase domain-containing protein [Gammaproteobacteria bacterium]
MSPIPPLLGLVLAGGASRRMSRDKGTLRYHDAPQAVHAWRLLIEVCGRAYVSANGRQAGTAPYSDLPLIVDARDYRGPASGLEAAWERHPGAAWLTLAVDMPLVDRALLEELTAARDPSACATAFRHDDGIIEPLCTIWEPAARVPLLERLTAGDASLRRFLETHAAALVAPGTPEKLRSIDDPAGHAALARTLRSSPES